ncbi:predicted protein, partial [Nematostella vectensis]
MRLVKPGLYAGTREDAMNYCQLKEAAINRVLTIDSQSLPDLQDDRQKKSLFVYCLDEPNADLLSHLDECIRFIEDGIKHEEPVLVHCLAGVSRSIAVILAYIMKSDQVSLDDAVNKMSEIYSSEISPNQGFLDQLKIYEEMGCKVNTSSALFKQYRLQLLASQIQGTIFTSCALFILEFKSPMERSQNIYKCKKCRVTLFNSGSTVEHETGSMPFNWQKKDQTHLNTSMPLCTSLFIEPVEWMLSGLQGTVAGKICCPKCSARLGSFNWAGMQCSCAAWITPAFQFHKNRIDE